MMKFYVLTSSSISGLYKNCITLPRKDTVVVINTLDDDYCSMAKRYCEKYNIEYYITESDGTPATGKNSVVELFLASDNEYMVQIDGDDLLTPHGIKLYKHLASSKTPIDMVVLYRQPQVKMNNFEWLYNGWDGDTSSLPEEWKLRYPMDKSDPIYRLQTPEFLFEYFVNKCGADKETAKIWAIDRYEFNQMMNRYSEVKEYMCRMVFYSRRAAEQVKFDNVIRVGEDTIQFLKLKKLALEGKLNIVRRKERRYPTYLYTLNPDQITITSSGGGISWEWLRPFLNELDKIKDGLPINKSLPEFKDPI